MIQVYDVYRICNGISEHRFTGTDKQCNEWIDHRGNNNRVCYSLENPHFIEI